MRPCNIQSQGGRFLTQPLKVVSLFDGISCGRVALERAGLVGGKAACSPMQPRYAVSHYAAFEIDKYAKAISRYNYPDTEHYGDVLNADFTRFKEYDIVMGGSPCAFWSQANKTNREIDNNGNGWKLFQKFVEAVRVISPRFFLFENVSSMPTAIKTLMSQELGCEPILINSALVSAQHRKRLYWTNIKGITQPEDKGIYLRDILETEVKSNKKANHNYTLTPYQPETQKHIPICVGQYGDGGQGNRIYSALGKSISLMAQSGGHGNKVGLYKIEPPDGSIVIRRLTPIEAERCQTLPDNYTALGIDENGKPVKISDTQRYRAIGNGWTVDVIAHVFQHMQ